MLCFWVSLYEEVVHGWGCSNPVAPRAIERRGRNRWNVAACLRASLYLSIMELTASPNRLEGASGASIKKTLSFSFISDRVNHRCLISATSAAMDCPMARAVSLVVRKARSAVLLSSVISSELNCSPSSSSFIRSAWYACNTDIVCRHAPACRAVVLESGLFFYRFFYRLGLVLDSLVFGLWLVSDLVIGLAKCSSWSRPSPAIYAFFLFPLIRLACSANG